jgi:DNA-binding transcriptional LysR family regulator
MLDVRRMRVLREVARQGTIAAAASALDFTPSAVSQQIATLEREAGIALVDRGPSSVVLTDAGRTLVAHADRVLAQLADAEADLRAIEGLSAGRLRLSAFTSVTDLTSRALREFRDRHPDVELSLDELDAQESIEALRGGELDIAVIYIYDHAPLLSGEAIEVHELLHDPIKVAVPSAHRLAERDRVTLGDLVGERWLTEGRGTDCHRMFEGVFRHAARIPDTTPLGSKDYRISQALVSAGLGVAFVPRLAQEPAPGLVFVETEEPVGRTIAAACRSGGRRSPAVATMIEILQDVATGRAT